MACACAAEALLTEQQAILGKDKFLPLSVMLPHDVLGSVWEFDQALFHYIFTGVPGDLEEYWRYNTDLAEDLKLTHSDACSSFIYIPIPHSSHCSDRYKA